MENISEKIKKIEKLVCENFEDLEIDDPTEEEIYKDYLLVCGATDEQIERFEEKFDVKMPKDIRELYRYKNGSKWFYLLFPNDKYNREFHYTILSLAEIEEEKKYFQNKDIINTEIYLSDSNNTDKLLKNINDCKIKPYLFHRKWIPFAKASGGVYLMMDFDPDENGIYGQIICYIHDPEEIVYIAETVTHIINDTLLNITF